MGCRELAWESVTEQGSDFQRIYRAAFMQDWPQIERNLEEFYINFIMFTLQGFHFHIGMRISFSVFAFDMSHVYLFVCLQTNMTLEWTLNELIYIWEFSAKYKKTLNMSKISYIYLLRYTKYG